MRKTKRGGLLPLLLTTLAGLAAVAPPPACADKALDKAPDWVGTWQAAPQLTEPNNLPPSPGLADTTLRQVVHITLGGKRMRVLFSNAYGDVPLTIQAAHVALPAGGGAIRSGTDHALTFHGAASVTIPPGAPVLSDPCAFPLAPQSDLTVTVAVRDASPHVTGHPGARATSYLAPGNAVSAPSLPGAATVEHWYYLAGVQVTADAGAVVVTLGDSLTDGRGSTTNGNDRWPDALARRLLADRRTAGVGVLNAGIGGNRVLNNGLGPCVLARLDRDVLAQPGARWMILLEGINDLGTHSASAPDLIGGYEQIIERAQARGLRVYGGTITPCGASFYFSPALEAERQAVNQWVRTSGRFDAVVDFDAALRDPQDPTRLRAAADSGDHLHLNPHGYGIMAGAIDLKLFSK